ncbi:MAG: NUDIX hydrolase [Pararhodobacter sp.]
MNPRFGEPRESGRRYTRRPGAYAVLWRDGQVLLTHQSEPRAEFQLPGGGIDPGESPVQALHREVFEETGWRIAAPRRLGAFRRFTYMPEYDLWAEKLCLIYVAMPVRRLDAPSEAGHTAHWMAPAEALGLLGNDGDAAFLYRVMEAQR